MRPQTRAGRDMRGPDPLPTATVPSRSLLIGLIGAGIQASRSPALHEREGEEQGLRCLYRLIDLDVLGLPAEAVGELLTAAERMSFAGVNVTHPCKQTVIGTLDRLSPEAEAIGAVNTVVFGKGGRVGHNTDSWGFAESFRRGMSGARLGHVVQIGAGGAGAAVATAALSLGAETLTIVDHVRDRAEALATRLGRYAGQRRITAETDAQAALADADGLINATPMGMAKYPGMPVPAELLRPGLWVADIVYTPIETALLRAARQAGCRTLSGGGMAVFQAVEAFRLFTGIVPDAARMLRHFETMIAPEPVKTSTNHIATGG